MKAGVQYRAIRAIFVVALASAAPDLFSADIISSANPDAILEVAKGFGSAELKTNSSGDPSISGRVEGTKYGIAFHGCKQGADCTDIMFFAGWSASDVTLEAINDWNRDTKFGKAYIKDKYVVLEMPVNLEKGVTADNFEDTFDWWGVVIKSFKEKVIDN